MIKTLEQRVKELRFKAQPINYSHVPISTRAGKTATGELEDYLKNRVIRGYIFVWGLKDMYGTKFIKGCCAKSIQERGPNSQAKYKCTFLWQHDQEDPLALFAVLEEDDYGLYFETKPLDDVPNGDRTITQIRSGTLNQFSGGFDYVWDKIEYDESDDSLVCKEIDLFEGSVVTIGAQPETYAIRSRGGLEKLFGETEEFIGTLPRKHQYEARQLFSRHKSLLDLEPDQRHEEEPPKNRKIDFDYLIKNL